MKIVIFIIGFLVFASCISIEKKVGKMDTLPEKREFISFTVKTSEKIQRDAKNVKVQLIFQNISSHEVLIAAPLSLGAHVMPFMKDSTGNELQIKFRLNRHPDSRLIAIKPNDKYIADFKYDLDECFDFTKPGSYELYFWYMGIIFNPEHVRITNEKPLESNTLTISVI